MIALFLFQLQRISLKSVSQNEFYLHFSNTYMHLNLQFYSYLYSEGLYWRVCS